MTIQELRKAGRDKLINANIFDASIKSDILLQYVLNITKINLIANAKKEVSEAEIAKYFQYINEVIEGKPVQYITNEQEFMKLKFYVDSNVLIPQPDTEILVEEAIRIASENNTINAKHTEENERNIETQASKPKEYNVLDLCTGSGAIAVALAYYTKELKIKIYASDISKKALEIAKKNAIMNKIDITTMHSNMFENIQELKFDVIVSNPPYIEKNVISTLSKEVQNEPHIALDGGIDGLDYYRIISKEGYKHVQQGGYILVEIGYNQKESVINIFKSEGKYADIKCIQDLNGKDRVIEVKVE